MSVGKNTFLNLSGNVIPLAVGAITIPILIKCLGVEKFGVLTILWTIIGYFSLFDFGVGRAITQQIASSISSKNEHEIPAVIKFGLIFTIYTGALGMIILAGISYLLSYSLLNVSVGIQRDVFHALIIAAIGIPFATISAGQRGALEGYEKFESSNLVRIFLGVSLFVFPLISFFIHGSSLAYMAGWLVFARILNCVLSFWYVRNLPCGSIFLAKLDNGIKRKLMTFGLWMSVTNLVSPLLVNADRFFISHIMGASVVAFYTVPMEFLVRLLVIPNALGTSLLPRLAKINSSGVGASSEASDLYIKSVKLIAFVMFIICLISALISYPLMKIFISVDFANQSWLIAVILAVGVFINGMAYIPYTAIQAKGNAKSTGVLHALEFIFYLPLLYFMVSRYGLVGAATAWTGRVVIDALCLFLIYRRMR